MLAYLPIIIVTICIFCGLSWQIFFPTTDPARYQCYALTFWLGSSATKLLPSGQCSFLLLTTPQPAFRLLPIEYPPMTLVPFSLALLAPLAYYQLGFALLMALVGVLIYWLLLCYGPLNSAPVFALYLLIGAIANAQARFDLLPAACTLICIIAAERRHWTAAYIALALGTLLKLYPALLLPALFIAEQQAQQDIQGTTRPLTLKPLYLWQTLYSLKCWHWRNSLWFFSIVLGVTGLFALLDFQGAVVSQLYYFLHRPIQVEATGSALLWLGKNFGFPVDITFTFGSINISSSLSTTLSLAFSLCFITGVAYTLLMQWRGKMDLTQASIALLLVFIATGKVFSPQYLMWLMPLLAYAGAFDAAWLLAWGSISALTTYIVIYFYTRPVSDPTLIPYTHSFFDFVAIRNMFFVLVTLAYLCNWLQLRQRKPVPTSAEERSDHASKSFLTV